MANVDAVTQADAAPSEIKPNSLEGYFGPIQDLGLESHIARLDNYGFTVIPPEIVGPPEFIERITAAVLRVAGERTGVEHRLDRAGATGKYNQTISGDGERGQYLLFYLLFEDQVFEEWLENPVFGAVMDYIMRGAGRLSNIDSFVKWKTPNPEEQLKTLRLHTDGPGSPEGVLPFSHDMVCNAALCLTEYSRENGCIAMVPGSHRRGRNPAPGDGVDTAVAVEAAVGSLIVWHGNTWHGSFPKLTDGLRLNVTTLHCNAALKTQHRFGRDVIPEEMLARRSERFRRILGIDDPMGWTTTGPDPELWASRK
jgi:ectoine hydroxylase-related dioxygenase (phytanoyl-CoA dioxygenase family)